MTLQTWELALIIGCGTLALLMCAYSVYILMRRRRAPPKPLTKVVVDTKEGRGNKDSTAVETKQTKPPAKRDSKTVEKKQVKPVERKDPKTAASTLNGASDGVIAVKIQPNNYAVTCPGGEKACVGPRKGGVLHTIPQENQYPRQRPRRDSAPSRVPGGRSSAPRV